MRLFFHAGKFFIFLFSTDFFFQNEPFQKNLSGTLDLSECQIVWFQIRTDIYLGPNFLQKLTADNKSWR